MQVRPYTERDKNDWDHFCKESAQGTFLHTRRFLSYHGDRFFDKSLIIFNNAEQWLGLFPAAIDPFDVAKIVSHPGLSYGGLIHQGGLLGEDLIAALYLIKAHYAHEGYRKLLYKMVPSIYHKMAAQDDSYALFRLSAQRIRCDLSSAIYLEKRLPLNTRRKRSFKKAIKAGLIIEEGTHLLPKFWPILIDNLEQKHQAKPVHNLDEITLLATLFPENIHCITALLEGQVIAGTVLFNTQSVAHTQYIAASKLGYDCSALDAVFEYAIVQATQQKKKWFDFGISNEDAGLVLNEGLYRFKSEFGGGGIVHEFFELTC